MVINLINVCVSAFVARAEDGDVEDEVEGEAKADKKDVRDEIKDEEDFSKKFAPSPDAQTTFHFVEPTSSQGESRLSAI